MEELQAPDESTLARVGAEAIAEHLRAAVAIHGRAVLACSGGRAPRGLLGVLAACEVPWHDVVLAQVDERVVPEGHPDRNWQLLQETLLAHVPIPRDQQLPMPVTDPDLDGAAARYASALRAAGDGRGVDVVHLGLGADGHTASLVPGDPAVEESVREVAITREYQGHRRMTLTVPAINQAGAIVWYVPGHDKAGALAALRGGTGIPASSVRRDPDVLLFTQAP